MGIDDETLTQQWIESADRELEKAKPKRRDFFTPPILEVKPRLTSYAASASSVTFAPGAVWHVDDPRRIIVAHGIQNSGLAKIVLPNV